MINDLFDDDNNNKKEYSNLKKIGITEPDSYVRGLFKVQDIEYLSSSCFADYYLHQIEEEIEDTLNRDGYSDLSVRTLIKKVSRKICTLDSTPLSDVINPFSPS